ncbi:putative lipid II flippase FtsW [Leifsonia sp. Leaf264]|uniref:putative lipid II flippase FtsW n=1 Tax=Leifsonia sp. Leaf264 TaxID=1736314 RepID=UPI0006F3D99B|nr:putative lipid II flippase FtsW [Leifsonia sp. Leaf264]KQO99757.1 cell division protein FtsW [Leifsonia sp. Leaf264]
MTSPPRTDPKPRLAPVEAAVSSARISLGRVFQAEGSTYFLLLGTTLFLVAFGIVMVLSSSSVGSYLANETPFGGAWKQLLFATLGIPLMLVASRMPAMFWRRVAWPALILGSVLQLIVVATPLGIEVGGNKNWLGIGGFQFQPSEIIKVALVIWLGNILWMKRDRLDDWKQTLVPVFLVGGGATGLVLLGGDLGTVIVMGSILFGALFFAGVKLRHIAFPLALGVVLAVFVAISSENRMKRIAAFFNESCVGNEQGSCWQTNNGDYALANGGIFGVGLGNSKAKWSWLPAADNDFIFAVIGEELGLIGAIVVLALFVLLAITFLRIMRQVPDLFARVATGSVMVWVIGQACINIGVVLGVIPVLGVPLPLISAGGTALLTTLFAIGIVLSFARAGYKPLVAPARRPQ